MNRLSTLLPVLGLALMLFSCDQNRMYEEYHSFDNAMWMESDSVVFDLETPTSSRGASLLALRYTEEYPFSNCYIKLVYRDSLKTVLLDTLLTVSLFDSKSGQPIGTGFGNTFTVYDSLSFPLPHQAKEVLLFQYMRKAELLGIEAVGFKVLKGEAIKS